MKNVKTLFAGLLLVVSNFSYAGLITLSETQTQTIDFQDFTFDWVITDWVAGTSVDITIELQGDLGHSTETALISAESVDFGTHGGFSNGLNGWTSLYSGGIDSWRVMRTFTLTSAEMATILSDDLFDLSIDLSNGVHIAYGAIDNVSPYAKVDVTYSSTAAIPEPSTIAIFALGALGLVARRVKK